MILKKDDIKLSQIIPSNKEDIKIIESENILK